MAKGQNVHTREQLLSREHMYKPSTKSHRKMVKAVYEQLVNALDSMSDIENDEILDIHAGLHEGAERIRMWLDAQKENKP